MARRVSCHPDHVCGVVCCCRGYSFSCGSVLYDLGRSVEVVHLITIIMSVS